MEDKHGNEPKEKDNRKWPVTYVIGQVRKVKVTWEVQHGEEKVYIYIL